MVAPESGKRGGASGDPPGVVRGAVWPALLGAHASAGAPRDPSTGELDGTCMSRHAGTRWLESTAPVAPGEDATIVFAIFDLSDSILDSFAFVDDFAWGCEDIGRPETQSVR